jgi:DNA-binding NarL/FixJ family response regulator
MPIRVLVADDSPIMRKAVRSILTGEPGIEIVGEATNVFEMMKMRNELEPDIVIMDLYMAEKSKTLPAEWNQTRSQFLGISSIDPIEGVLKAHLMGVAAFLDKMDLASTLIPKIFELNVGNT